MIEDTATGLYTILEEHGKKMGMIKNDDSQFPKNPSALSVRLGRLEKSLAYIGINVVKNRETSKRSIIIDFTNWSGDKRGSQTQDSFDDVPTVVEESNPGDQISVPYKCYYCKANAYETKSQQEYEYHNLKLHPRLPMYPGHSDIEKLGLVPQGKTWEDDKIEDVTKQEVKSP
jgi:hypothetical protein